MHLSDGVIPLNEPWGLALCGGSGLLAAAGFMFSARGMRAEEVARVGLITVWVFVASSINIRLGGVGLHLGLYGLAGFFLRRRLFMATVPALLLQVLLMQHGGWTTLGVNTLTTSSAAIVGWGLALPSWPSVKARAFLAGFLGIMAGATLTALVLRLAHYDRAIWYFWSMYLPLAAVEGVITATAMGAIERLRPRALQAPGMAAVIALDEH